jgi:hypothetical protein
LRQGGMAIYEKPRTKTAGPVLSWYHESQPGIANGSARPTKAAVSQSYPRKFRVHCRRLPCSVIRESGCRITRAGAYATGVTLARPDDTWPERRPGAPADQWAMSPAQRPEARDCGGATTKSETTTGSCAQAPVLWYCTCRDREEYMRTKGKGKWKEKG